MGQHTGSGMDATMRIKMDDYVFAFNNFDTHGFAPFRIKEYQA